MILYYPKKVKCFIGTKQNVNAESVTVSTFYLLLPPSYLIITLRSGGDESPPRISYSTQSVTC